MGDPVLVPKEAKNNNQPIHVLRMKKSDKAYECILENRE